MTPRVNSALVPPAVLTLTAPNALPVSSGTVNLTRVPELNTSAPALLAASTTTTSPNRYSPTPSLKPSPLNITTALVPSAATLCTCTSLTTGTTCSGKLPSGGKVWVLPTWENTLTSPDVAPTGTTK